MISVINGKVEGFLGRGKIYIGRGNISYALGGSVLQNKFTIGKDGKRADVISKYRKWLWAEFNKREDVYRELVRIAEKVKAGEKVQLACWCKPLDCHGDVIKKCIEWMIQEGLV